MPSVLNQLMDLAQAHSEAGVILAVGLSCSLIIRSIGPALTGLADYTRARKEKDKSK